MSVKSLHHTAIALFTLALVLSAAFSARTLAAEPWVEGQHYQVIAPPVAVGNTEDVVVTEFFWYGCGHCYTFEPMLTAWGKQLPEGAVVQPSPAVWNDPMRMHAKAFYIAEVLGVKAVMHPVIFDAMHLQRKRLVSRLELRDLFEDNGVDPDKFDKERQDAESLRMETDTELQKLKKDFGMKDQKWQTWPDPKARAAAAKAIQDLRIARGEAGVAAPPKPAAKKKALI